MYLGNQPATNFETVRKDRFTGLTGTNVSLSYAVTSVNDIIVWVNSVKQDYNNYTVSGSTLTLGGALVSADIVEIAYIARTFQSVNPPAGSVGASQITDGTIGLAKLSATGTKDSTTFLRGDNTFASAGGTMTPYFYVKRSSNQTVSSSANVVIQFNSVLFDTASGYNTGTYRYTPNVAGKYYFQTALQSTYSGTAPVNEYVYIGKNGADVVEASARGNPHGYGNIPLASVILDMNGTTDYINVTYYGDASTPILEGTGSLARSYLLGYKIIE